MKFKNRFKRSNSFYKKVNKVVPLAAQTFSKSYLMYVRGTAPLFAARAKGAYIWDIDGNKYIDYINGLLPVILGYQYKVVDDAIKKQLKKGITFSLSSTLEYELAKLLVKHIPSAKMVRYAKNGSDVTTAAIRLSRAVTEREHVAVCGYHGWHDWYISTTDKDVGIPKAVGKLTHKFSYNEIGSLEKVLKKYKCAAVILEPMNVEMPKDDFLKKVKALSHKHGAVLVFDEIITGFRHGLGGAQKRFKVTPDLTTIGKSMGNGMPISAIVGKRKYMEKINGVFFSGTFGGEALSLAASIATIKEMEQKKVAEKIWKNGKYLQNEVNELIKKNDLLELIQVKGAPCWHIFSFKGKGKFTDMDIKSFIQQELLRRGIIWYGQHNMSFSHSKKDLDKTIRAYGEIFPELRKAIEEKTLLKKIEGTPIHSDTFKVR
jgi:glutamate-1-semialdehyde 2,1-aminomutase|tara:strand:- start:32743 stop:34035 length:1293 start_codon:yes stop_codon:yes gene_type:complete